jgi:hypothetical protein
MKNAIKYISFKEIYLILYSNTARVLLLIYSYPRCNCVEDFFYMFMCYTLKKCKDY